MARINWKGRDVAARMAAAAQLGIDKTMSECVSTAKRDHPWVNRDGFEEGSIRMGAATLKGRKVTGRWGAYARYSLFLEIGTSRIGATAFMREQAGGGMMWAIPGPKPEEGEKVRQSFTILPPGSMDDQADWVTLRDRPSIGEGPLMAPRPFLRPAADLHYRRLRYYIGAAFRGESL